ncbi:hypothetical protein [Massilia antarctica]|uniref:hypothetical protein n=1 Tax=Massilia antarctica TaxID=2765360 RepID=UPI0006BB5749|nr:hypothetical protein [Massilia sp. H27-R4]MCY0912781.1 hypothetical protein [Massilia sp. H27-R4]CUI03859.1 hypothetical protein BN2497_2495 [Janthinobacterium sp. CG23_2]CUU27645.1 hypothetical protein BN3177_2495 [Janthinobacterium sp. CG23_2]
MTHVEQASGAQALGPLIAAYGKSRSFLFVGWFMAALFAVVGLFVLWLTTRIGPNFRFSGDVSLLYAVGFGALALGAAIAFFIWRLAASQPAFQLFDNGIRASGPDGDHVTLYRDLEDLYTFFYGGIGYRAAVNAPWTFIGSRIHKFGELSERLRALQVAHRGEVLHQQLQAGKPATFRYLEDSVAQSKSMVASRNMNFPTFEMALTAHRLQIGQKSIDIGRIANINTNVWTETSSIMDVDGKVFHKVHPSSILSFDLLCALIARQQQAMR